MKFLLKTGCRPTWQSLHEKKGLESERDAEETM